jgi:hypothetical protein
MKIIIIALILSLICISQANASYNTTNVVKDIGTNTPQDSEHPIALVQSIRMHSRVLNGLYHPKIFTSSGTATDIDSYLVGSSSTGILISLPLASTIANGTATKVYVIKNIGAGTITLSPTIDGVGSPTVSQNKSVSVFTDGNLWYEEISDRTGNADTLDNVDGTGYARSGANTDITSLTPTLITATNATITNGTITTLSVTTGSVSSFNAITGTIANLSSTDGTITSLYNTNGNISNLVSTIGTITTVNATTGNITNVSSTVGTFTGTVSVGGLLGINYLRQWQVDSTIGTGNVALVPGAGIAITPAYDNNGHGTITVTGVGTNTAGGWVDTGTQTVATANYNIVAQGTLTLSPIHGVSGLLDRDVPNTITLDNLNQITTRNFNVLQGSATDAQVPDDITLTNVTQITNRSISSLTGTVTPPMLPSGCIVSYAYGSNTTFGSWTASTAVIPYDNTIPQSSEGVQILTVNHTPGSTTTRLRIRAVAHIGANDTNSNAVLALFKDSEPSARACSQTGYANDGGTVPPTVIEYDILSPGTSAATWKLRGGTSVSSSNLFTVNGSYNAAKLGGTLITSLSIQEYVP